MNVYTSKVTWASRLIIVAVRVQQLIVSLSTLEVNRTETECTESDFIQHTRKGATLSVVCVMLPRFGDSNQSQIIVASYSQDSCIFARSSRGQPSNPS